MITQAIKAMNFFLYFFRLIEQKIRLVFFLFLFINIASLSCCYGHISEARFSSHLKGYVFKKSVAMFSETEYTPFSVVRKGQDEYQKKIRSSAVKEASSLVGTDFLKNSADFIEYIYCKLKINLNLSSSNSSIDSVGQIFKFTKENGYLYIKKPLIGDLVFFCDSDFRFITHVGIVKKIIPNGTIVFIHHFGKSIVCSRMNLDFPKLRYEKKTGERLNHLLVSKSKVSSPKTAAELFVAFGNYSNSRGH